MSVARCLEEMPKVIKIGAYDWTIKVDPGADAERCGYCDFEVHTITLWAGNLTSPSHVAGILIHECLHVIFDNEKLGKLKKEKESREEQIVQAYETGLVSLFRDNGGLLVWMKKWLKK